MIRTFDKAPATAPKLLKAALPTLPGIGGLPGIKHTGETAPDLVLELKNVSTDKAHLARYNEICRYAPTDILPPMYPHFAAFGLHLSLMTDTSFPFAPMGVVHLRNRLVQHRPVGVDETFDLSVKAHDLRPHPKGRLIDITTTATISDEEVWSETMTIFSRGRGAGDEPTRPPLDNVDAPVGPVQWKLKGDLGRRFASVSGDRNPIHLYPLTAKAFGFPTNIAHGMWTVSAALAALQNRLPKTYAVEAEFRKPVLLPTTVVFGSRVNDGAITFGVTSAKNGATHLVGQVIPA
ncbi:MAG: MaoC/PaaZ C-terminal domain-containing protein [Aeromicrobium sp.]